MTLNQVVANRIAMRLPAAASAKVIVEAFDYGNQLGAAVVLPGGRRHAVRAKIAGDDVTDAADMAAMALAEWIANG